MVFNMIYMVSYRIVSYRIAWYGMAWYIMVWYGMMWCGGHGPAATPDLLPRGERKKRFIYIYIHTYMQGRGLCRRPSKGRRRSECPQATKKELQQEVYDAKGCFSGAREMPHYSHSDGHK